MSSTKQYLYPKCEKRTKSTSGLTKHFNVYTNKVSQMAYLYKLHNDKIDTLDKDL